MYQKNGDRDLEQSSLSAYDHMMEHEFMRQIRKTIIASGCDSLFL
jgi:hypothetical protein